MPDLPHPATIKTSAPSLVGVIERPRLISALGELPTAAKWLLAPSGTGKSTLAASYARSLAKPFAWYRLDERDNDPAFFYEEFSDSVSAQLQLTEALPRFSADDHRRHGEFAQRYFGAFAAQIDRNVLIVIDDMHRLVAEAMLLSLAALIDRSGAWIEVLFVSEAIAPAEFFDAIAARRLTLLNDADLHFDIDECKAMTGARRINLVQSETLATLTAGHAGALVLACELMRGKNSASVSGVQTIERIHSHLLSKLIERLPTARRDLLLKTAFVTQLTRAIAAALAELEPDEHLDALVESRVLRRVGTGDAEAFEAHGLVRQGMQALVRARIGKAEAHKLADRTAAVLIEHDQEEAAFDLLVKIGETASALAVAQRLSERYASQGQVDLLMNSLAKLPASEVERNAWLCFWIGQAQMQIDEEQARAWFTRSYSAFEEAGDRYGMRLAAASNVTAFQLECGDLRELDLWVERHRSAGGDTPVSIDDRFETTLIMGVICAAFVRARYPSEIDSEALTARLRLLVDSPSPWLSQDQRVQGARLLIEHCEAFAKFEQGASIILATRSLIDDRIGGALHRGRWLIIAANLYASDTSAGKAVGYLNEARSLAKQTEASRLLFELGFASANHWMKAQELSRAADELSGLQQLATKAAPAQRAEYAKLMTRLLLLQGRSAEGLQWAEEAMRIATPAGFSGANLRGFEMELVYGLAANERFSDAIDLVSRLEFEPREVAAAVKYCLRFLLEGENELQLLREGLRSAAQINFLNLLDRARGPLARICAFALANDIETEFVHRVIELKQLKPPAFAGPHWPWTVHVRTLGGFRLDIKGKRYRPSHKAQDKPLELLKLLVTCQALGRAASDKTWIVERLWPDAAAENARKSLDMTVSRLRRLLGDDDTIVANEGRLQLSSELVWSDIQPLRHALSEASRQRDAKLSGSKIVMSEATATVTAVLQLYEGPYFQNEEGPAWLLSGREAIATAVRQALLTADLILDGSVDEKLIPALEKALAADPASEDLARSLMGALLRRGRNSEAVQVYRRLRQMLSLLLGIAPSAETDHIRDRAYVAPSTSVP